MLVDFIKYCDWLFKLVIMYLVVGIENYDLDGFVLVWSVEVGKYIY